MRLPHLSLALGAVVAVLLALTACTQAPASWSDQPAASVIAQAEGDEGATALGGQAVVPCRSTDPKYIVYVEPGQRYCFVFPGELRIGEVTTRTVSLQNPQVMDATPVLIVRLEPAPPGKSLAQIVDERLLRAKGQQPNLLVKRQAVEFNGHAGEEIIGLPGRPDAHWLFVLRGEDVMTLLFRPSRGATEATRSLEQALWQQVRASFHFLDQHAD